MITTRLKTLLLGASALLAAGAIAAPAQGVMRTDRLGPNLCLTTGGGKFVKVPGFPGEKIDRRLLNDIKLLRRKYEIFLTDGYSMDPVHSINGEHPLGLGADIVPAAGGSWRQITALANMAEPRQDRPKAPFRWVGYDGDANHGRGHHLHLSWNHSESKPGRPARSVYTLRCPGDRDRDGGGDGDGGDKDGTDGGDRRDSDSGGITPTGDGTGGFGVGRTLAQMSFGGPVVVETDGVSRR